MARLEWTSGEGTEPIPLGSRPVILGGRTPSFPDYFPDVAEVLADGAGGHRIRALTRDVSVAVEGRRLPAQGGEGVPLVEGAEISLGGVASLRYTRAEGEDEGPRTFSTHISSSHVAAPRFESFCGFARGVGVQIDLEKGLDVALRLLLDLFPHARRAAVYLQTRPGDWTWLEEPRLQRHRRGEERPRAFSSHLAQQLLAGPGSRVILCLDTQDDPDVAALESVEGGYLLAASLVPETGGGDPLPRGILCLDRVDSRGAPPFTQEDAELLEAAASLLSGFLQRVSLHRLSLDLAYAAQVQEMFLPRDIPRLAGYDLSAVFVPSSQVSGDFYDVHSHEGGLLVLLGDVSGKSFPAALLMAQVVATFRARLHDGPLAALRAVDRELSVHGGFCYATAILADVRPDGRATLYVCGHPPAYVRRRGRWERLPDFPATLPLGMEPERFAPTGLEVELAPGDAILLYTDGLTEAHSPSGGRDLLGDRGVESILASAPADPAALLAAVQARVLEHSRGTLGDDLTLLAIARRPDA